MSKAEKLAREIIAFPFLYLAVVSTGIARLSASIPLVNGSIQNLNALITGICFYSIDRITFPNSSRQMPSLGEYVYDITTASNDPSWKYPLEKRLLEYEEESNVFAWVKEQEARRQKQLTGGKGNE